MGYSSHVFPMIFVFFFFITSFYCTQIFIARTSLSEEEYYNYCPDIVPGLKQVHYVGNYRAGLVREQDQEPLILKKFRILLGPKKNLRAYKSRNGVSAYISPSPSPSPSANGATAPTPRLGVHIHQPLMRHHSSLSPYKQKQKNFDRGRVEEHTRVLTAVLASVGVICCVLCAVGLFFGCRKFNKQKRTKRSVAIYTTKSRTKGISKFINSQSSAKKVSSDPGPDLFYLDSLETALEQDVCRAEQLIDSGRTCLSRSSNYVEITTVHQIPESVNGNPEGCNFPCIERVITEEVSVFDDKIVTEGVNIFDDKIIPEEAHSSDDESFHSFCHSCSSQARNSNVSACSLSEFSKVIPQDEQTEESHFSKAVEILHSIPILSVPISQLQSPSNIPPPPPPPPPLPPSASMHISSHHQTPSSKRMKPNLKPTTLEDFSFSKAPTTIPAPPLPPSLPKENIINSFKFPPPLPSQLIQQMPLGKDGSPLPKLKPLHWDKVRATPDRSTVWDKLRSSSFEFDEEMIESLFGYNLQNPIKNDEEKSKTQSPSKHVLDPKRLQNITILSKALNVNAEQVCGALVHGYGLSLQDLEALSKMVPTREEEDKLSNYKGDDLELGSAEKLVKAMLKIPFAFARIEAMLYRETFEDEVLHLIKSFSMLEEACKELRSSRLFLKLLEAVLKTGNRMNIGTIRGGAKAFKLDALLKLADVKGTDGKTTLLHFVVQEIVRSEGLRVSESIMGKINMRSKNTNVEDNEENYRKMGLDLVSGLSSELCNVKKTATLDLDVLANSVTNLSDSMNKLQYLVQKDMKMEETKGNFVKSMLSFLTCAELKLKELQLHENRVLSHVKEITEYFHGDVSKDETNPLRIFVIVRDFLSMLDHVCKELKNSKTLRSPNPRAPFR